VNSELWDVAMICDLNEALGREIARLFPVGKVTASYEEMLADTRIDVIGIYTPDHLHGRHIVMALEAGKHVICTKPLTTDLSEGRRILKAAAASDRKVFVGQSTRFFEPMMKQRERWEAGKIGEICTAEAYYNADHRWFLEKAWARSKEFKWLFGGLSHPLDLIRWYLPDIEEVMAYGDVSSNAKALGHGNRDIMHIILRTASGRIARVSGTYSCPLPPEERDSGMSCILRGEKGSTQADYHELRYSEQIEGSDPVITRFNRDDYYFRFGGHHHHAGEYQNYIEYFARCLDEGKTPYPDVREGLVTVACMMAVDRSLEQGRPVKTGEILKENQLEELI